MDSFQTIDVAGALEKIQQQDAQLLDIRDPQAFATARPSMAVALNQDNMHQVLNQLEFDQPIIVICYHGISSQQAAQYLIGQGFEEVYSLQGGFEAWRLVADYIEGE